MSASDSFYCGFDDLESILKEYGEQVSESKIIDVLEVGADEFVKILNKLPRPKSKITAPGYKHLVNSFSYKKNKRQVEVGWGKYYGPMQERGTSHNKANPHLMPAWERNKEVVYKKMISKIGGTF